MKTDCIILFRRLLAWLWESYCHFKKRKACDQRGLLNRSLLPITFEGSRLHCLCNNKPQPCLTTNSTQQGESDADLGEAKKRSIVQRARSGNLSNLIHEQLEDNDRSLLIRDQDGIKRKDMELLLQTIHSEMPDVRSIFINQCKLKEIPSELWLSFFSLPHLTAMHLGCNQLSHLQCSAVNVESHIEYLDLSDNRLLKLPTTIIKACPHLIYLNLSSNVLTEYPGDEFHHSMLQRLDLSHNQFKSMPSMDNFPRLLDLIISHNQITVTAPHKFPAKISHLDLSHNRIGDLQRFDWKAIERLSSLNLSHNPIENLEALSHCIRVVELKLDHCQLTSFPPAVQNMPNLEVLHLRGNRLPQLPPSLFHHCQELVELSLQDNNITSLPIELTQSRYLKRLFLEFNHVTHLPQELLDLKSLTVLTLHHNELTVQPKFLRKMSNLLLLIFRNNRLNTYMVESIENEVYQRMLCVYTQLRGEIQSTTSQDATGSSGSPTHSPSTTRKGSLYTPKISVSAGNRTVPEERVNRAYSVGAVVDAFLNIPPGLTHRTSPPSSPSSSWLTSSGGHSSSKDPEKEGTSPTYSKFREIYEEMIQSRGYTKDTQDKLNRLPLDQKWGLIKRYHPFHVHYLNVNKKMRSCWKVGRILEYLLTLRAMSSGANLSIRNSLSSLSIDLKVDHNHLCLQFIEMGGVEILEDLMTSYVTEGGKKIESDHMVEVIKCSQHILQHEGGIILSQYSLLDKLCLLMDAESSVSVQCLYVICGLSTACQNMSTTNNQGNGSASAYASLGNTVSSGAGQWTNQLIHTTGSEDDQSDLLEPKDGYKRMYSQQWNGVRDALLYAMVYRFKCLGRQRKESGPLDVLIRLVSRAMQEEREHSHLTMILTLINDLINSEPDLDGRFMFRVQLINLGINRLYQDIIQACEGPLKDKKETIVECIALFQRISDQDRADVRNRYGRYKLWQLDLQSSSGEKIPDLTVVIEKEFVGPIVVDRVGEERGREFLEKCLQTFRVKSHRQVTRGILLYTPGGREWLDEDLPLSQQIQDPRYGVYGIRRLSIQIECTVEREISMKSYSLDPSTGVVELFRMVAKDCNIGRFEENHYAIYTNPGGGVPNSDNRIQPDEIGTLLEDTKTIENYLSNIIDCKEGEAEFRFQRRPISVVLVRNKKQGGYLPFLFSHSTLVQTVKSIVLRESGESGSVDEWSLLSSLPPLTSSSFRFNPSPSVPMNDHVTIFSCCPEGEKDLYVKLQMTNRLYKIKCEEKTIMQMIDMTIVPSIIATILSQVHFGLPPANESTPYSLFWSNSEQSEVPLSPHISMKDQDIPPPSNDVYLTLREARYIASNENIWTDEEQIEYNDGKMYCAPLNRMIEMATPTKEPETEEERDFPDVFIFCFRSFTTCDHVFDKLVERYNVPAKLNMATAQKGEVKKAVALFIDRWKRPPHHHDTPFLTRLESLTAEAGMDSPPIEVEIVPPPLVSISNRYKPGKDLGIFDIDPMDFAKQTTLPAQHLFRQINYAEFYDAAWDEEDLKCAPNMKKMIQDSDDLVTLVITSIVTCKKLKERVKHLSYFLKLALAYRELKNYHHMMSIHSALCGSTLSRLQWTFDRLSKKSLAELEEINRFCSSSNNYLTYREAIKERSYPCIPALNILIEEFIQVKDLPIRTFDGRILLSRVNHFYQLVKTVMACQRVPYDIEEMKPIKDFISRANRMNDGQLHQLSNEVEPMGATRSEIE
ncbi:lipoprotein [Planoprotostelium fungivorum]|uniref:Lipoprotein n=1 Tax=Planoprotostelium fungivorum TaxID=1890364 RepID=A0A2P6N1N4_9EUKA|nr:lipoprotein [Planoprotostelium fungivorum]